MIELLLPVISYLHILSNRIIELNLPNCSGHGQSLGLSCHSTDMRPTQIIPELTSEPLDVMQITCDNGVFKNGEVAVNVEKVTCDTYFDPEIEIHKPTSDSETPCSKLVADGRKSSEVEDNGLKRVSIGWKLKGQHQTQVLNRYKNIQPPVFS